MGQSFHLTTDRYPAASLGCGTLVIIALIVAIFSNAGNRNTADQLTSLRNQVEELKKSVDVQTDQIRGLKDLIQGRSSVPKAAQAQPKN